MSERLNRTAWAVLILIAAGHCFAVEESTEVPDLPLPATSRLGDATGEWKGDVPWWRQRKIVLMWGHWWPSRQAADGSTLSKSNPSKKLPPSLFRNLSQAGATVYVEGWGFDISNARLAHDAGLRCFASVFAYDLSARIPPKHPGRFRRAVTRSGELSDEKKGWCPLDESLYEQWMVSPHLEGVREGLIDGLFFDWEPYAGHDEAGICYCDDCFARFMRRSDVQGEIPEPAKRFTRLEEAGLIEAYEENFTRRRVEMYSRLIGKLRAVNPRLLVASYRSYRWAFIRAVHAPETPFTVLARRHYHTDDRQPWWESYSAWMKAQGFLCVPGGHMNALFGAQTSQVSAARWLYEAAINEDGVWLWFQRHLDDEIFRAYATADTRIKAVEHAVGEFFARGSEDRTLVTAVEWTGRPELEQAVVVRTRHLGDRHLVHVNNVDTEWPLRVRLRWPRLEEAKRWTARDPLSGLHYSPDGTGAEWTTSRLRTGLTVPMEPRNDLFILVEPARAGVSVDRSALIRSRDFDALLDHARAAKLADKVKTVPVPPRRIENSIYGDRLEAILASTKKLFELPARDWRFQHDRADKGERDGWFRPEYTLDGWASIEIGDFWGDKGGKGAGWYRRDIEVPPLPEGERVYLHFGAVDEELVLWIDGKQVGDFTHRLGPDYGWITPFAIDVTGRLTPGRHHLAMRVYNIAGAGGVWKPVGIFVGPGSGPASAPIKEAPRVAAHEGTLVYTATESMGYGGDDAPLTIANTLRRINIRTGAQLRVRQLRGHLWSPKFSPDGRRIAFVQDVGGRGQIFVMNEGGSGVVNLSDNAHSDRFPVWSPDGRQIAFASDREADWDIHLMNADGTDQRRVAGNPGVDRAAAWSPDGTQLAWESHVSGVPNLWLCDADGGDARPLIAPGRPPEVYFFDRTKLIPDTFYLTNPVWSPDGTQLAASMLHHHLAYRAVVLDRDGSSITVVSKNTSPILVRWAPDGTQLAVSGWEHAQSPTPELTWIYLAHADFKPEDPRYPRTSRCGDVPLLEILSSPGPRQVFANELPAQGDVFDLRTWYSHGSALPRRVLKRVHCLAWSPDGKALAFSSDMDPSGAYHVYVVSRDGGAPVKLAGTASAWPQQISWRAK